MDLVAGPMSSLVIKLGELLKEEYKLQAGVRAEVERLQRDLEHAHAALQEVAKFRSDQLDGLVKLWARDIREASYDMEDIVDAFLVRMEDGDGYQPYSMKRLRKKMARLFTKSKPRHKIARAIEDVREKLRQVTERRGTYNIHDVVPKIASSSHNDDVVPKTGSLPHNCHRVSDMYNNMTKLAGIEKPRDELISMLMSQPDDMSRKIACVVGPGGLGKTTIARQVYDKLKGDFSCAAFISVGQQPDANKVLKDILIDVDKDLYSENNVTIWNQVQRTKELLLFLDKRRYLIVIDDIWDIASWKTIASALCNNNMGSRIIVTTQKTDVANEVGNSYVLEHLTKEESKVLFHQRIFDFKDNCPQEFAELSEKILKKCGGVPLAIITISSLLAHKSKNIKEWEEVYKYIGSGHGNHEDMSNMRTILSLSYHDLPPHLKTCLLYLSIFPEDYEIQRDELIWRWIAEGFIQSEKPSDRLFEVGYRYFHELINRSLVQPAGGNSEDGFYSCRVHDMVLDLICSISNEENFVTILSGSEENTSTGSTSRRLSLRYKATTNNNTETTTTMRQPCTILSQVRSFIVFPPHVDLMPFFSSFGVLRVLDLGEWDIKGGDPILDLRYIGNLTHLRYLRLGKMGVCELPTQIGKLHFLQILCSRGHQHLPRNIIGLRRLLCLDGVYVRKLPNVNWSSLEVLDRVILYKGSFDIVEQLSQLTRLRVLWIDIYLVFITTSHLEAICKSLSNLKEIQKLTVCDLRNTNIHFEWDNWAPPLNIQELDLSFCTFRKLPKWLNDPASLCFLSRLVFQVPIVKPEDLEILGKLPSLRYLSLQGSQWIPYWKLERRFLVRADAFPSLRSWDVGGIQIVPSVFPQGAMTKLESFEFHIRLGDFTNGHFNLDDLSMGHLPSLQSVRVELYHPRRINGADSFWARADIHIRHYDTSREDAEEDMKKKVEEVMRRSLHDHPNRPKLHIYY
ncbi:hypothetical protein ACP4OV_024501 [Aristida adscensionis]